MLKRCNVKAEPPSKEKGWGCFYLHIIIFAILRYQIHFFNTFYPSNNAETEYFVNFVFMEWFATTTDYKIEELIYDYIFDYERFT